MFVACIEIIIYQNLSEYLKDKTHSFFYLTKSMQQSPSLEANRSSDGREISRTLWNPEGSLQHSQDLTTCPCSEPEVQVQGLVKCFVTLLSFYSE
jgi:hypothetical protein